MWSSMRVAVFLAALGAASAVTPIEKVVGLLKDLQAKVEKQGAKEAAQYDAYACFCRDQAEFKKQAIEKSEEKIEVLNADIEDLDSEIKELDGDIATLGEDITKLKADIEEATEKRAEEHKEYLVKAKDLNEAIDACKEAIDALQGSKKAMKGNADLDLVQLKTAALTVKVSQTPQALAQALAMVRLANKAAQESGGEVAEDQKPAAFKYQSNDIIATIQELQKTFKENKRDLDNDEFEAKDAQEKNILGMNSEQTFKEQDKQEKETLSEQKTEEKSEAEQTKDEEQAMEDSDESFLSTVEAECEKKAKQWDQRSKARADEISALADATATLEEGALSRQGANKKLVGLTEVSPKDDVKKEAAPVPVSKPAEKQPAKKASPSFLQIRSVGSSQQAAIQRVIARLDSEASRLHSPILAAVTLKVTAKGVDHFSNVRSLIKDLLDKLTADAEAEADQKGFCDTEIGKAVQSRDEQRLNIEEQNGIIAKKTSLKNEKAEEIVELSKAIATLHKDFMEAEELRKKESAANEETINESTAGAEAVKDALGTLEGFYGKAALLQGKPPKSDRYGHTFADDAPEAFNTEYDGEKSSAKGILGILEVIQSDFERTAKVTKENEDAAQKDFDEYKEKTDKDVEEKTKAKEEATTAKEEAEAAIVQAKDDLDDAQGLEEAALAELEKLSPMCVQGEETYEERVQKRKDEIEALKSAYKILDEWKS